MARLVVATRTASEVVEDIIARFEECGFAMVPAYNRFEFVRVTPAAVIVLREKGTEAAVPKKDIEAVVELVRGDHSAYIDGPTRTRKANVSHVNSPVRA
jgi:hypothetical protein